LGWTFSLGLAHVYRSRELAEAAIKRNTAKIAGGKYMTRSEYGLWAQENLPLHHNERNTAVNPTAKPCDECGKLTHYFLMPNPNIRWCGCGYFSDDGSGIADVDDYHFAAYAQ